MTCFLSNPSFSPGQVGPLHSWPCRLLPTSVPPGLSASAVFPTWPVYSMLHLLGGFLPRLKVKTETKLTHAFPVCLGVSEALSFRRVMSSFSLWAHMPVPSGREAENECPLLQGKASWLTNVLEKLQPKAGSGWSVLSHAKWYAVGRIGKECT